MAKPENPFGELRRALVLGLVVFGASFFWTHPIPGPSLWEPLAQAAGLRPPEHVTPGLWRFLASGLFQLFGAAGAITALGFLGKIALGWFAAGTYLVVRELMSPVTGLPDRLAGRYRLLDRTASVLGAVAFTCAGPVWRLGQFFGPDTFALTLALLLAFLFVRIIFGGRLWMTRVLWLLLGIQCAEGPLGVALLTIVVAFFLWAVCATLRKPSAPIFNPAVIQLSAWRGTLLTMIGFMGMVALNICSFQAADGLGALGLEPLDLDKTYLLDLLSRLRGAATPVGWSLVGVFSVGACALVSILVPMNRDEDELPSFRISVAFLALLVIGFLPLMFCTDGLYGHLSSSSIKSPLLYALALWLSTITFVQTLCVFGTDLYCRNYRRIAMTRYPELFEEESASKYMELFSAATFWRRLAMFLVPVVVLALTLPGVVQRQERACLALIDDFVSETLREMGDATWLFTDGSLDPWIELRALEDGRFVHTASLLSTRRPREAWIRAAGTEDPEDRELLRLGAWETVRAWALEKSGREADFAVQVGFEAWQREHRNLPVCGGVLGRIVGLKEGDGVEVAKALAERLFDIWEGGLSSWRVDAKVRDALLFVQWRLSRMARMRGYIAGQKGETNLAREELEFADWLDEKNPSAQRVQAHNDWMRRERGEGLTPREGLRIALERADFKLARRYARPILASDPGDPRANFAYGMAFFIEKQYAQAESYLKRMLERDPKEAAAWNNLAVVYLRTGRLKDAEEHAAKAAELAPDSPEVKTLQANIKAAKNGTLQK